MNFLKTPSGARLSSFSTESDFISPKLQWLFVPGGPGLGSESLHLLTSELSSLGKIWHFDFPLDGSNFEVPPDAMTILNWKKALMEAILFLGENTVLVGHSFGGMFILDNPALESKIRALVLLDSAPTNKWHKGPFISPSIESNEQFKQMTLEGASHFFTASGLTTGRSILENLPYSYQSFLLAANHFHPFFHYKWVPSKILTYIIHGEMDSLTPIDLYYECKEFDRQNIKMISIQEASHFPWIEQKEKMVHLFHEIFPKIEETI